MSPDGRSIRCSAGEAGEEAPATPGNKIASVQPTSEWHLASSIVSLAWPGRRSSSNRHPAYGRDVWPNAHARRRWDSPEPSLVLEREAMPPHAHMTSRRAPIYTK